MPKVNKKIKVLMALSGGVDSSVAAALLVKQGYSVTAAYMVNYDDKDEGVRSNGQAMASCWIPDYRDAVRVAAHLNIPIIKLDFTKEYKEKVLDYMFAEYNAGRTPNPDVLCNKYVKFGVWLDHARKLGFDYLATGHYAQLSRTTSHVARNKVNSELLHDACYVLRAAKDSNKDQTYFLHQLNQQQLSHTMFPIGEYTKPEVRKLAAKFKLPTADKEESMGICFIGEVPMKEFLEQRIPPKKGKIITADGTVVGEHDGLAFYTIGQRHLGIKNQELGIKNVASQPMYVVDKNVAKNELVVGYENDSALYKKEIEVSEVNWIAGQLPKFPLKCEVRLRHRERLQKCTVHPLEGVGSRSDRGVLVRFAKPERAVTPGQFAVFYKGGECLGGGVIN